MKLYNLGKVPWLDSQLIYHALAHMGQEALSLVSPATPYVCIGFHQDVEQPVRDLAFLCGHGSSGVQGSGLRGQRRPRVLLGSSGE